MSKNSSSSGIGFCGLLTIVFIVLKLLDKINWSWWWVLSPMWLWIPVVFGILGICLVGFLIFIGIVYLLEKLKWI